MAYFFFQTKLSQMTALFFFEKVGNCCKYILSKKNYSCLDKNKGSREII